MAQGITLKSKNNTKVHIKTIKLSCLMVLIALLCLFSVLVTTKADIVNAKYLAYIPSVDDFMTGDEEYCSYTFAYEYDNKVVISQGVFFFAGYPHRANELIVELTPYGYSNNNGNMNIRLALVGTSDISDEALVDCYFRNIVYDLDGLDSGTSTNILNIKSAPYNWEFSRFQLGSGSLEINTVRLNNPFNWATSPCEIVCGIVGDEGMGAPWSRNLFFSNTHNVKIDGNWSTYLGGNDKRGLIPYTQSYYEFVEFWYNRRLLVHEIAGALNDTEQLNYLKGILDALNKANADGEYEATVAQSQLDKQEALKSEQKYQDDFVNNNKDVLDNVDTNLETTDLTNYFDWLNNRFFITLLISSLTIAIVFFSLFGGR